MRTSEQKSTILVAKLPDVPSNVEARHLDVNGKLLTDFQIQLIKGLFDPETYSATINNIFKSMSDEEKKELSPEVVNFFQNIQPLTTEEKSQLAKTNRSRVLKDIPKFTAPYDVLRLKDEKNDWQYFVIYSGGATKPERKQKLLGKGGEGKVKLVQNLETGTWHALKIPEPEISSEKVKKETATLNSAGYRALAFDRIDNSYGPDKDRAQTFLLMDVIPGKNLLKIVNEKVEMPTKHRLELVVSLIAAEKNLQDKGIIHGDIKTDNYLVDLMLRKVRPVDFGISLVWDKEKFPDGVPVEDVVGHPIYVAPELYKTQIYNETTEVYSLGMVCAEILDLVEKNDNRWDLKMSVLKDTNAPEFKNNTAVQPESLRKEALAFIQLMTNAEPSVRPSMEKCLEFFKKMELNLIDIPASFKKVGILNVNEYFNSDVSQQQDLIKALSHVDEVQFINVGAAADAVELLNLKKALELSGIRVAENLYTMQESKDFLHEVVATAQTQNTDDKISSYYYVSRLPLQTLTAQEHEVFIVNVSNQTSEKDFSQHFDKRISQTELEHIFKTLEAEKSELLKQSQLATLNEMALKKEADQLGYIINNMRSEYQKEPPTIRGLIQQFHNIEQLIPDAKTKYGQATNFFKQKKNQQDNTQDSALTKDDINQSKTP